MVREHQIVGFSPRNTVKALEPWLSLNSIGKAIEWWLRSALPVAAIVLAVYSMYTGSVQLQIAQRTQEITVSHYFETEGPASVYERVSQDLISLDNKIERAEQWVAQSVMPEASITELQQSLYEAKRWRQETDRALLEHRLVDAERYSARAHENVDKVLRELSKQVFELPIVTAWGQGFLSVGIDNLATGRTKEGEPLQTVVVVVADPPILPVYPHRLVYCYDTSPGEAVFDEPATFTFPYNPEDIPFGFHEGDLLVAEWDPKDEEWSILGHTKVDLQQKTVSVSVNRLSYFAVVAQYPQLSQPIGWIAATAIVVGLSLLLAFGNRAIASRSQQGGGRSLTCRVCEHEWFPRVPTPKQCPRCRSRDWNGR